MRSAMMRYAYMLYILRMSVGLCCMNYSCCGD